MKERGLCHNHFSFVSASQILHYFLADDTVEIREVHEPNDGRDPFPVLLARQKLAKNTDTVPCK